MFANVTILIKKDHPSFTAGLRSDGIVHFEMKDVADYDVEIIKEQIEFLFEAGKGEKFPLMLTFTSFHNTNEKTNQFAAKEGNLKYAKAIAVVVDSLASRLRSNFYLIFFKPETPTKLFNSQKDAVKWLKKVQQKQKKSALA